MTAGPTYTPIATTTLASSASSYTFTSIPSTYTDLVLVGTYTSNAATQTVNLTVNGDTSTNYSFTYINGDGTSAASSRSTSDNRFAVGWTGTSTTNLENNFICSLQNYANTTTYKTFLSRANSPSRLVTAFVGLWRSTSAINSISFTPGGNNFIAGSTFTLYGISSA